MKRLIVLVSLCLVVAGCGRTVQVYQVGPSTYKAVVKPSTWGDNNEIGPEHEALALKAATDFCEQQNKVMIPVQTEAVKGKYLMTSRDRYELLFWALPPEDPRARQPIAPRHPSDININLDIKK